MATVVRTCIHARAVVPSVTITDYDCPPNYSNHNPQPNALQSDIILHPVIITAQLAIGIMVEFANPRSSVACSVHTST